MSEKHGVRTTYAETEEDIAHRSRSKRILPSSRTHQASSLPVHRFAGSFSDDLRTCGVLHAIVNLGLRYRYSGSYQEDWNGFV